MDPKTVLLVEDNSDNRAIYTIYLEHFGFRVAAAASGQDALELARDGPDVILLDISLPGLDGWTVARLLKEDDRTKAIPIIALTAHALPEHRARAREVGCDGYLAKPVSPKRVLEEIRRVIRVDA